MTTLRWIRLGRPGLVALCLNTGATECRPQGRSWQEVAADAAGFRSSRIACRRSEWCRRRRKRVSSPQSTDLPNIAAYQARWPAQARPNAKPGDLFTPAA
jgi:hypothetical protein